MLYYLSSLATNEETGDKQAYSREPGRERQGKALELADNEAILVAAFVIPSAISVHLHTFLFPFARRFI